MGARGANASESASQALGSRNGQGTAGDQRVAAKRLIKADKILDPGQPYDSERPPRGVERSLRIQRVEIGINAFAIARGAERERVRSRLLQVEIRGIFALDRRAAGKRVGNLAEGD